jgi:Cys-rich protein (TIGR01571 family)
MSSDKHSGSSLLGLSPWKTALFECCETGSKNCCYSLFCPLCAQGDIAKAAGRDYFTSCCIIPCLCPCYVPCHIACSDREALAARYGVHDDIKGLFACLVLSFMPCGHALMLTQELNEITLGKPKSDGPQVVVVQQGYGGLPMQTYNGQAIQQQQGGQGYYPPPGTGQQNGVGK